MDTKKVAPYIIFVVFAVGFYFYFSAKESSYKNITTFKECVDAGFPLLETYPEQCMTPDRRTFVNETQTKGTTTEPTQTTSTIIERPNVITVESLKQNDVLESGVPITGKARGYWYFEGSFPVELLDSTGKRLAIIAAQAKSDWMSEDYVPFAATLNFTPLTATGTIIFHKDNPSGEKERDDSISATVRFNREMKNVKLYYYNESLDKDNSGKVLCSAKGLTPVTRSIPLTESPLQDTLAVLLSQPQTSEETTSGIRNLYPLQGVSLQKVILSKNTLTVTINDPFNKTRGAECERNILRLQLEKTAKEFNDVKSITILPEVIFKP